MSSGFHKGTVSHFSTLSIKVIGLRALAKLFIQAAGSDSRHVQHVRFPNGGGWSFFVCPCGRRCRALRLLEGAVVCRNCCERRRIRWRASSMSRRQRAEHRIPKLKAMLESPAPLRLKPALKWSAMEKRLRHEATLRECEFRAVRKVKAEVEAAPDPAGEPGFRVPRRWRDRWR
jgi:hypothetical protein